MPDAGEDLVEPLVDEARGLATPERQVWHASFVYYRFAVLAQILKWGILLGFFHSVPSSSTCQTICTRPREDDQPS